MIDIRLEDDGVISALRRLQDQFENIDPVLGQIGEYMLHATTRRFAEGKAPDGSSWARNSPVTLSRKKDHRPLFGNSGVSAGLNHQIFPEVGADYVSIYSSEKYARMMQFGGLRSQFPHLWGDIPARPFFGFSEQDTENIRDIVVEAIAAAWGGS